MTENLVPGAVIGIGNFDGVHLGHQKLIKHVKALADEKKTQAAVYTFSPHPARVLHATKAPPLITSPQCRFKMLKSMGIEVIIEECFTPEFARLSPQEFVREIIFENLRPACIVVGENYRFGYKAQGNIDTLKILLNPYLIDLEVIPSLEIDGAVCSSSRIRKLIAAGEVEKGAHLLGRNFCYSGLVKNGSGRGRSIAIATANLDAHNELLPGLGVYATLVEHDKKTYMGATNIGVRPTFEGNAAPLVETHILDFNEDIYGQEIKLFFVAKIRDEQRFESVDDLVEQIRKDVVKVRELCHAHTPAP